LAKYGEVSHCPSGVPPFDPDVRDDIQALVAEGKAQIVLVQAEYQQALQQQHAGGTLRVRIKNVLENQRSALEYLANGLHEALGGSVSKRVYYPVSLAPKDFPALINGQMPAVQAGSPLYQAIEAAQPYKPGYEWLGHLAVLTRENKHHRLTPQIRDETRVVRVGMLGSGAVQYRPYQEGKGGVRFGKGVSIGGVPVDPATQRPVPSPTQTIVDRVYVDWQFDEPRVSVLSTLKQTQDGLPKLIHDVLSASGL
jgi:hypothetical protein